jgi:hypothetical protein
MEDASSQHDSVSITKLKTEWLDIEKQLLSKFNALNEHLVRAEQANSDPAEVAEVMRTEIDSCLDRLNQVKVELADLRRDP